MHHGSFSESEQESAAYQFFFSDDPDLANVVTSMKDWSEAHPCECEALCICDKERS